MTASATRSAAARIAALSLVAGLALPGAARAYPIAQERALGERFVRETGPMIPQVREPRVLAFVRRLGGQIVGQLSAPQPFDYEFRVVRAGDLNAFAVPGGFVYLNAGVILGAESEAEVAGVLAHEIAHVHAHHIVRQQEKSQLANYAAIAGILLSTVQPALGAAALGASATAELSYRRDFEREADFLGMNYMRAAGFEVRGLPSFLERIAAQHRQSSTLPPPYMLSHPITDERIAALQAGIRGDVEAPGWRKPSRELEIVQAILRGRVRRPSASAPPSSSWGRALAAIERLHVGDGRGAAEGLTLAQAAGEKGLEAFLGEALLRSGEIEKALRWLRAALESDPADVAARGAYGAALIQKGDFDGARRELQRALQELPEYDQAESDLGLALGRAGEAGLGFYHLAESKLRRGDAEGALRDYRRALESLPKESPERASAAKRLQQLEKEGFGNR